MSRLLCTAYFTPVHRTRLPESREFEIVMGYTPIKLIGVYFGEEQMISTEDISGRYFKFLIFNT